VRSRVTEQSRCPVVRPRQPLQAPAPTKPVRARRRLAAPLHCSAVVVCAVRLVRPRLSEQIFFGHAREIRLHSADLCHTVTQLSTDALSLPPRCILLLLFPLPTPPYAMVHLVQVATCNLNQWAMDFDLNLHNVLDSCRTNRTGKAERAEGRSIQTRQNSPATGEYDAAFSDRHGQGSWCSFSHWS
jgi:hypothetical protein